MVKPLKSSWTYFFIAYAGWLPCAVASLILPKPWRGIVALTGLAWLATFYSISWVLNRRETKARKAELAALDKRLRELLAQSVQSAQYVQSLQGWYNGTQSGPTEKQAVDTLNKRAKERLKSNGSNL